MPLKLEVEVTHPKSICVCGHTGDGPGSFHAGTIGHGFCLSVGCKCPKFTWDRFTDYGEKLMQQIKETK